MSCSCITTIARSNACATGSPDERMVGHMEAFSGGVMLYVSCMDLLPESATVVGLSPALVGVIFGAVIFWLIARLVPDPTYAIASAVKDSHFQHEPPSPLSIGSRRKHSSLDKKHHDILTRRVQTIESSAPDLESNIDDADADRELEPQDKNIKYISEKVGSVDSTNGDYQRAIGSFQSESISDKSEKQRNREYRRLQVLRTAFVTTLGICIHNFPEGLALYLSTLKGLRLVPYL